MNSVMKIIKDENLEVLKQDFDNLCTMYLKVRESDYARIKSKIENLREISLDLERIA